MCFLRQRKYVLKFHEILANGILFPAGRFPLRTLEQFLNDKLIVATDEL